jgi:glutamate formiminotransferase/formiminotetrahydrofolate cyclodeaminase
MEDTVSLARKLAQRVGKELHIPVYCYAEAALKPERFNLSNIRAGEYEELRGKLSNPNWTPDFGPTGFNPKAGATVIGARDFLIAYNVNLNTSNVSIAREIARTVRESGRIKRELNGKALRIPGSLKGVKALGWYIQEYQCCQVSMNLTDIQTTPIHIAFDEVQKKARAYGIQVNGSELIGLVPLHALREAGEYAVRNQHNAVRNQHDSDRITDTKIITAAIEYLGLTALGSFDPQTRIIEYALQNKIRFESKQ